MKHVNSITDISKFLLTFRSIGTEINFDSVFNASLQSVGVDDGQTIKLHMVDINKIHVWQCLK